MMVTVRSARYSRATVFGIVSAMAAALTLAFAGGAQAKGEYEINDTRESAHGPLAGGKWHTAEIETENDVDWYYFYVKTYSQMEFLSTMVKAGGTYCSRVVFSMYDKDGNDLGGADYFYSGSLEETGRFPLTMNPGRYYLKVDSCTKDRYKFKIDPDAAITTNRECGEAIVARDSVGPALAEVTADLNETNNSLAAANAVVRSSKLELAKLKRRWEKAKKGWRVTQRKIKRHPGATRFQNRERRRLKASKARVNRTLAAAKGLAKRELATASETRAEVLAVRAPLQALAAQHTSAKSQAEAQIAVSC